MRTEQPPKPAPEKPATAAKPSRFGGSAPKCPKCSKSVHAAEQVLAAGGACHKACLCCSSCNKGLDSSTLNDRDGVLVRLSAGVPRRHP